MHHEGRTIAGVRINRWGAVMRDYSLIRDNILNCQALMTSTSIQLFDVNHRTLLQWHNERSKAMMRDTVSVAVPGPSAPQEAAEPLSASRALLTEPVQPDQTLAHRLHEDTTGQAVTHRGPLAPTLYELLCATAASSSSDAPSTSAAASSAPTAAASSAPTAAASSAPTAAASSAPTAAASAASAAPTAAASSAASSSAASSSAPTAAAASSQPAVPRSTAWQRKMREQHQQQQSQDEGALLKAPRKTFKHFRCKRCGQPKTKEYGHSRYGGEHFCSWAEGRSVEEWLAEKRRKDP
ncbi:uncharacterized protein LOC144543533 [Centroberyx gerrardi]